MSATTDLDDPLILWGRCRSGRRWFWAASDFDDNSAHGWADTEEQAVSDAGAAVERLAAGRAATVRVMHGVASQTLRDVNAERRKTRPAEGTDAGVVEYLYGVATGRYDADDEWQPAHVVSFQITRKTAKRIYYVARNRGLESEVRCVDRQQIEATGEVRPQSRGWFEPDARLYLAPPVLEEPAVVPDLAALKAEMAAAHPDRGGSDEAFIAARERYERARR